MATVQRALPAQEPRQGWKRYAAIWARNEELSLLLILAIVVSFFLVAEPATRQGKVYWDLLWEISPTLIAAVGITMLMLAAQFDLSIGSMLAFTGVATVTAMNRTDSMWIGIAVGLATGPLIGAINGFLVTYVGMQSLMTTLGMMFALRGLVYVYTNKTPVVDENQFTQFTRLWFGKVGPIRAPVILALLLVALAWYVLSQTEFGRNIYAIGGNEQAARVSGISVRAIMFCALRDLELLRGGGRIVGSGANRHRLFRCRRAGIRADRHCGGGARRGQYGRRPGQHHQRRAGGGHSRNDRQGHAPHGHQYHATTPGGRRCNACGGLLPPVAPPHCGPPAQ